uniref:C2H2-type domain-containing protein n=1 Tax=Knipowitschia caucasica TaxID=637954 RepID=A0AAV2JX48_KNICA
MDQLNSHKLRHQEKSLICEVCAYSCKRKHQLRQHMVSKHSEKNHVSAVYQCKFCPYSSSHRQALRNHENCKHTKARQFQCALCSYTSFSAVSLFLHKRKAHGYVPGDQAWLQNYALKEKEKNITGDLTVFFSNATSKAPTDGNPTEVSPKDASKTSAKADSVCDLNVLTQEVAKSDNVESPSEEYCTLVLTTLPSNDGQSTIPHDMIKKSIDVAEHGSLSGQTASVAGSSSSDEASLDKTNQVEELENIEQSVESCGEVLLNDNIVKDLKELEKIEANAMVLDGHVEVLMLPTQTSRKTNADKKLRCEDCVESVFKPTQNS